MKRIFTYIFIVLAGIVCLQNNKAYAQNADDKTKSIILNKYLTPTEDPSKFKITLSSFVHSDEQPVKQSLDIALVLDHSSSMCASDEVWTEVATGKNMRDILCLDMNYNKNGNADPKKHTNPFFNQQRQITINNITYPLMYYQREISTTDINNMQEADNRDDDDKRKRDKERDRKWYELAIKPYYTTVSRTTALRDFTGKALQTGNWYYFVEGTGWKQYTSFSASDKVEAQMRIDILRDASIKFIETLYNSASNWLTINVDVTKFCQNVYNTELKDVTTNKDDLINFILTGGKDGGNIIAQGTNYNGAVKSVIDNVLTNKSSSTHRNIMVIFSDGCPYASGETRDGNGNNAVKYIGDNFKYIKGTKQDFNFVYSVGLLNGAADGWSQNKMENLLRALSSDYPEAKSMFEHPDDKPSKEDKYYSFANPDKLAQIFEDIAHSATADMYPLTDNNSSAVDIMSNSFSLPEGFTAADVSVHTETCTGIADGYDPNNLSDQSFTWTKGTVNGQYYEDADHQPAIAVDQQTQKIVVTNYNYSLKDGVAPATNVKGNWVGGRILFENGIPVKDASGNFVYTYGGKRLVVEFTVNYNGEPGFNIPSNDTKCGIYPNTTGTGEPIKEYNRPMADFPAIIIVKEGLKAGESSIFKVSKGTDYICSLILTGTGETYKAGDMAVNKGFYNSGDPIPAIGIIRDLEYGEYTVEELPWSWAYTMTSYHTGGSTTVTQTLAKENIPTEAEAVAAWTAASASGKFTGTAYYVINDGITLAYRFKNTPKTSQPLHGESDALNEMPVGDEGGTGDEEEI